MPVGKKYGGRKKGTPNKLTQDMREAIREAFDKAGGVDYLLEVAEKDPKTFLALVGKIVPTEVKADVDAVINVITGVPRGDD